MQQSPEEKIRRTVAEINHFTDAGDYDGWVGLFAENGSFHMLGQSHVGREALRSFIEQDQPSHLRGLHLTTDSVISLLGDEAEVKSNFMFIASGKSAGVLVAAGQYHDILVPCDDRWLFKRREVFLFGPVATESWGPGS